MTGHLRVILSTEEMYTYDTGMKVYVIVPSGGGLCLFPFSDGE